MWLVYVLEMLKLYELLVGNDGEAEAEDAYAPQDTSGCGRGQLWQEAIGGEVQDHGANGDQAFPCP